MDQFREAVSAITIGFFVFIALVSLAGISTPHAQAWQPPPPTPQERDWLKLKSGEWLWGDLKELRDKDLQFESEELDLLKLDWDDIAEFRSARILTYRFEQAGIFTGTATIRGQTVTIQTVGGVKEFPRADLLLILEGAPREINYWSVYSTTNFVGRKGNTEQTDLTASLRIRRQTPRARFDIKYEANMGRVAGVPSINNHNFMTVLDAVVKAGFYVTPSEISLFHDEFKNIDLKTTLAAGAGYFVFRGGDLDWSVGVTAGYVKTTYISVQEGEASSDDSFLSTPATKLDWDITDDIEYSLDYNVQVSIPDTRNAFHSASSILSFDIWGDILSLDFSVTWDRNESPKPDAEGRVPERDDFRTSIGIGIEL